MSTPKPIAQTVLNEIIKRLESTEKFVVEQAPQVCTELLAEEKYRLCGHLVLEVLGLIGSTIGLVATIKYAEDAGLRFFGCFGSILFLGLSTISFISTVVELATLRVCPKITLIRKLKRLVE